MLIYALGLLFVLQCASLRSVYSTSIADIQGAAFRSPYEGQSVQNVTGVVTVKLSAGFYIQSNPVQDARVSTGLYVYSSSSKILGTVQVGDLVSLSGNVQEYRSKSYPTYLLGTQLSSPANVTVLSSNNTVRPVVLGVDRSPPTQYLSALDIGHDGFLAVPGNQSQVEVKNATSQPTKFGLDFWSSLEGELVTVPKPVSIGFENAYGEFWVRGHWKATGGNARGGLTLVFGPDGIPDPGPEAVLIGTPADGTKNPAVCVGKTLSDITGVVQYQFGFYYIIPLTAPTILTVPDAAVPPTKLTSISNNGCAVTLGDYNVDNMGPDSSHLPTIATHIASYLKTPDLMFLQEIQDNSGKTSDGTVSGNVTLSNLSAAIASQSSVTYNFTEIAPVDGQDGGIPGGNIRPAYLFNPKRVSLVSGSSTGGPLDAVKPVFGHDGRLTLNFNPGRIDPTNAAWDASRKPLVAAWQTASGARFFTINVHDASKSGGGSSVQGDPRPPLNSDIEQRTAQVQVIATFIKSVLKMDPLANVIISGDFNEFVQTRSAFAAFNGIAFEVDDLAGLAPEEKYTYVYGNLMEQLDHIFVSPVMALRKVEVEHVHVNTWAPSYDAKTSDHDPSVARVRVCGL